MAQVNHPATYEEVQEDMGAHDATGVAITMEGGTSVVCGSAAPEAVERFRGRE
jgi:hypothetical protein